MPAIRSSSDLRNSYNEISEFCNKYHDPVFITKNGTVDLVVLSNEEYERLVGKQELCRQLEIGLADMNQSKHRLAKDVFAGIGRELGFGGA